MRLNLVHKSNFVVQILTFNPLIDFARLRWNEASLIALGTFRQFCAHKGTEK